MACDLRDSVIRRIRRLAPAVQYDDQEGGIACWGANCWVRLQLPLVVRHRLQASEMLLLPEKT